jgi:glutamate-1-semialdehyde 2,1-aminomutase
VGGVDGEAVDLLDVPGDAGVPDIDGYEYIDFCLGGTGAMAGHSPAPQ